MQGLRKLFIVVSDIFIKDKQISNCVLTELLGQKAHRNGVRLHTQRHKVIISLNINRMIEGVAEILSIKFTMFAREGVPN
jgi:hypothetical protein